MKQKLDFLNEKIKQFPEYQKKFDIEIDSIKKYYKHGIDIFSKMEQNKDKLNSKSVIPFLFGWTEFIDDSDYNYKEDYKNVLPNPSYPDIDTDFSDKDAVLKYLKEKYGDSNVYEISSWTAFSTKSCPRNLLTIHNVPFKESNKFCLKLNKELNFNENIESIKKEFDSEINDKEKNKLKWYINFYERYKQILDYTNRFVGIIKQIGTHTSGIVITNKPVYKLIPVERIKGKILTAYSESARDTSLEKIGIVKFDVLGIKALEIIKQTKELIQLNYNKTKNDIEEEIKNIDKSNEKLYEEFKSYNKWNIFQFGSESVSNYARKLNVDSFKDIVALNALNRPGPLNSIGDEFIEAKKGKKRYENDLINKILKDTYGVILYQEQIMEIFHKIGNFSLAEADIVRRTMKKLDKSKDKKLYDYWNVLLNKFKNNAIKNGVDKIEINKITDDMLAFQEYSFNKSHATAYAYIALTTLYFSVYYRKEFYASCLNVRHKETDEIIKGIKVIRKNKLNIKNPDINKSDTYFVPDKESNDIVFGLVLIKNVGIKAIEPILKNKPYNNIQDFLCNPNLHNVSGFNIKSLRSLIKVGAFDKLFPNRNRLEKLVELFWSTRPNKENRNKDTLLKHFNKIINENKESLKQIKFQTQEEEMENEKEYLGFILNFSFPNDLIDKLEKIKNLIYWDFNSVKKRSKKIPVMIKEIETLYDRNENLMAKLNCFDINGNIQNILIFASYYKYLKNLINKNKFYLITVYKSDSTIILGQKDWIESRIKIRGMIKSLN